MKETKADWIFYLNLSDKLSQNFYILDKIFKEKGYTLIPVSYSSLLNLSHELDKIHVVCMVTNGKEFSRFAKKVRKFLKMMIQNEVMDLYFASSFQTLNDTAHFRGKKNYHFVRLPMSAQLFCDTIVTTIELKNNKKLSWPGGKSPRPTMLNGI
jgi:hypothetical protein